MISKKLLAASILAAMGTSAHAIGFQAGDWKMDISGSVNAYYTSTSCDRNDAITGTLSACGSLVANQDADNVQNGLLPGFIIFSASTTQNGYDLGATISIDPGTTSNGGANALFGGGLGQGVADQRRVFLTFGNADMGTIKMGRDIGLFGQNAILNDMSLLAVGGGSGFNGALNTTLGAIGNGYVYTQFQPQITYTAPAMGGLGLSGGIFQPIATDGNGDRNVGFQGLATYALGNGKLWGAFVSQSVDQAPGAGRAVADITGFEIGGTMSFGGLGLTANYFTGEGLGTGLFGQGGTGAVQNGQATERDSQGYLLQATYKVGDTKFGVNYGVSELDATAADRAANSNMLDENEQYTVGVYHNLTPSLTLAGEYTSTEAKGQLGQQGNIQESDTLSIGAIIFF